MSDNILSLLEDIIHGRNEFLSTNTLRILPFGNRSTIITHYLNNEAVYVDLINRIYTSNRQESQLREAARTLVMFSIPSEGESLQPVRVAPTQQQINSSIEDVTNASSNCAICQEAISSGGCRIRHCGHFYHRTCAMSWFSISVRCPVCRYDIREGSLANQTSSVEAGMSSQSSSQSEEQNI